MYKQNKMQPTSIKNNDSYQGETIEMKIQRFINNKEPLGDEAPLIYTERSEGIQAAYNIRTDRWEVAVDAMEKVSQSKLATRAQRQAERTYDTLNDIQRDEFHKKYPNSKIKQITKTEGKA